MLVHHPLSGLLAQQVPFSGLRERVHHEVLRARAGGYRLLLRRRATRVHRRSDKTEKDIPQLQVSAELRAEEMTEALLKRLNGRCRSVQEESGLGTQAKRAIAHRFDSRAVRADCLSEGAAGLVSLLFRQLAPLPVHGKEGELDAQRGRRLRVGRALTSRLHVSSARSSVPIRPLGGQRGRLWRRGTLRHVPLSLLDAGFPSEGAAACS